MSAHRTSATRTAAHVPLQPPGSIRVAVDLTVGGAHYQVRSLGECHYSAIATIHHAPGQMWSVRQHDTTRDVNFTLWRLRGGDTFTLSITTGGTAHRVSTLPVGPPSERRGSGKSTVATRGKSGQFTIDAVAETGARVTGTLSCSGFLSPEENGN